LVEALRYKPEGRWFVPDGVIEIIPAVLWPWSRLSRQQKRVPRIFPGGKGGRCVGLTTFLPSSRDCLEIWEPRHPGNLRACKGFTLPIIQCTSQLRFYIRSLTLRRLMSYIFMEHPFLMFLDHTQRRSTVGRTPLD